MSTFLGAREHVREQLRARERRCTCICRARTGGQPPGASGKVISADFVEVNPVLDHQNGTARLAVGLLASLFAKKIL